MILATRQLVLKKLAIAFPAPAAAEKALQSLDRYGNCSTQPCAELVHLAIIKLSEGSLWRLRELVRTAKHDFRDVLYPAEAPERFRQLHENPPGRWGQLSGRKEMKPSKRAAMEKRDQAQWIEWLTS